MPTRRRGTFARSFRRGSRPLRPVEWQRVLWGDTQVTEVTRKAEVVLVDTVPMQQYTSPTIMRTHLQIYGTALAGSGNLIHGVFGVTTVLANEASPCPLVEGNSSRWMLWRPFTLREIIATQTGTELPTYGVGFNEWVFDIRARRRCDDRTSLILVCELASEATAGMNFVGGASVLIKE